MKYDTPYKTRKLWKQVNQNEINVNNLKKLNIISHSLSYSKNIHTYETDWDSWLNLPCPTISSWDSVTSVPSQAFMIIIELKLFPERFIPFIEINLIAKTIADGEKGEPNSDYVDKFDTLIVDASNWYYSYIIKREEETDGEYAQTYKAENNEYPPKFYLISYIDLEFKEEANNLPLEFKQLITINTPKFDEVRKSKS